MATEVKPITAEPAPFPFRPAACALLIIDMQRDFLEPGGFGAALGNDVAQLRRAIAPNQRLLAAWRQHRLPVWHTREGHAADLSDLPANKHSRGAPTPGIGDAGPMGRILIRGEAGHALIPELAPLPDEVIIDKPGKGAFYTTDLHAQLTARGITQLIITGVTTEVCVHSTVREANDRGFDCLVLSDATASYFPEFHLTGLAMIKAQGGIFGWVSDTLSVLATLNSLSSSP
jgi:biuret amidohydrolase